MRILQAPRTTLNVGNSSFNFTSHNELENCQTEDTMQWLVFYCRSDGCFCYHKIFFTPRNLVVFDRQCFGVKS